MIFDDIAKRAERRWICALLLLTAGMLTACGTRQAGTGQDQTIQGKSEQEQIVQPEGNESDTQPPVSEDIGNEQVAGNVTAGEEDNAQPSDDGTGAADDLQTDEIRNRFGENCISEQTFEVELSEYDGKVWFVPYAPAEEGQELDIQIVQDGEILTKLQPYVPDQLEGQSFTSLDAVTFFDINYDNCTDIVLIETYGNTTFAAVYYGFAHDEKEDYRSFNVQWTLSEIISDKTNPVTIAGIRELLGDKKNGEFTSYQEAYTQIVKLCELEYGSELTYDLIQFDHDDMPELVIADNGFWVSLYTYHDGRAYSLMDHWGYGVMGNAGYEYIPGGNRVRNYNSDYAGAIRYNTYMSMNDQYSLKTVTEIVTYNFDDVNGDGYPDADEEDSIGYYSVSYVDGVEITDEQYAGYDAGEYEFIAGRMSREELMRALAE